ncbi:MAG: choice-of-anchor tandem repeat NxxGxxAF-containing protein [Planctomycetota bacterium]
MSEQRRHRFFTDSICYLLAVVTLGVLHAQPTRAALTTTKIIAASGQTAPDGDGSFRFAASGALNSVYLPTLNQAGEVAFLGLQTNSSGGIFTSDANGQLTQIARRGTPAPDVNGSFWFFSNPSLNDAGEVAFYSVLEGTSNDSGSEFGIFRSEGSGNLARVVRAGDAAPDGNGIFYDGSRQIVGSPAINSTGQIAFHGFLSDTSGLSQTDGFVNDFSGVFLSNGSEPPLQIARAGGNSPDGNGRFESFFPDNPRAALALNDAGEVAFYAALDDTVHSTFGGAIYDDTGIFLGDGLGNLVQIARGGDPVPDGNGNFAGLGLSSSRTNGDMALNSEGQVAFVALQIGTRGGSRDNSGIFLGDGVNLMQIARQGEPVPDGSGVFASFTQITKSFVTLNDQGQVAFYSDILNSSGNSSIGSGVFRGDGLTSPIQIVRSGEQAPGGNGSFTNFGPLVALNNQGQIAFQAELLGTSGGSSDDLGIFLHDEVMGLIQIVREGDDLLGSSITFLQFLANESIGSRGSTKEHIGLNDRGQLVYRFGLADGRGGIAVATIVPEPGTAALSTLVLLAMTCRRQPR